MKPTIGRIFKDGLFKNNPVFAQVLGICSTLAVTNVVKNTLFMCAGVIFALSLSTMTISFMRNIIPSRVRMMVETLVMAVYVIIVDIMLKAYFPEISVTLGPYVGLIITNCILMGRIEAFGISNPPHLAFVDGISAGLGYSYVLITIAFVRELLGSGTIWGIHVLGNSWTNWSLMVMAGGAFFVLAVFIWVVKGLILKEEAK